MASPAGALSRLSLSRLPWTQQVGAFAFVSLAALAGFWYFYVRPAKADIAARQARLATLRVEVAKALQTTRRVPEFERESAQLDARLRNLRAELPEEKDVAGVLRRLEGLASESSLSIQRFTPQPTVQQAMYSEVPIKLQAEGTFHDLGAFFDRISKFPRIINISQISIKASPAGARRATIVAECVATTFVLGDRKSPAGATSPAQAGVPR